MRAFDYMLDDSLIRLNVIGECVIAAVKLNGHVYLAKNRDRGYHAKVNVIHEIVNGTEVILWHDLDTDWCEGMNEHGVGVVNSSLMVRKDEKESEQVKDNVDILNKSHKQRKTTDGMKIKRALSFTSVDEVVDSLLGKIGEPALNGHTIVSDGHDIYALEVTTRYEPTAAKLGSDTNVFVRSNHGIIHPNVGYIYGKKKESSHDRLNLAHQHLDKVSHKREILDVLKAKYKSDPFLNPYRAENPYNMYTTGQILMDLFNKSVTIRMDKDLSEFRGIDNRLPKHYKPKIRVTIEH